MASQEIQELVARVDAKRRARTTQLAPPARDESHVPGIPLVIQHWNDAAPENWEAISSTTTLRVHINRAALKVYDKAVYVYDSQGKVHSGYEARFLGGSQLVHKEGDAGCGVPNQLYLTTDHPILLRTKK